MKRFWNGIPPTECQLCYEPLNDTFIDGKLPNGTWAIICHSCGEKYNVELGTGQGQMYDKIIVDGKVQWQCIAGFSITEMLEDEICKICKEPQIHCECV